MNELTDFLDSAGGVAGNVLGALNKPKTVVQQQAASSSSTNWGVIAAIGGGLLLVIVFVVALGGRGR